MDKSIPDYILKLLWDVQKDSVDITQHAAFIIRRVLDYGDARALNWLRRTYSDYQIKQVIQAKRGLAHKTQVFWTEYFKLQKENV